ncbi:putative PEP-binding protein [Streptomyces sp. NPDC052301]|uniref:putative PEP-binding protein n=1 Tax=Streptomyces sp. NPDC052301 TaxID=3365687 RepID=UPI0037D9667C
MTVTQSLPLDLDLTLSGRLDSGSASLPSRTVVKTDLPFAATAFRGAPPAGDAGALLLVEQSLTFSTVRTALDDPRIAGVAVGEKHFADHARKMLQEGGKALVLVEDLAAVREGGRYQVDNDGLVDLDRLPLPVTAICSYMNDDNEALYKAWNIHDVGYFRLKFCLFQLFAEEPEAFYSDERIEEYLTASVAELAARGWRRIRLVLSDPTSAELRETGIEVAEEANPELGVRGPRIADRWWPELRAIGRVLEDHPELRIDVSIPFVSTIAEFQHVAAMFQEAGLDERVGLGMTLEVPAMLYELPELIETCRPAFVAVGTSDLFALLNGVDRSSDQVKVDPFSRVNRQVVDHICEIAAKHGVHFFVCGELRRNPETLRQLASSGCGELIAAASVVEIARMNRAAAQYGDTRSAA